MKKYKILIIDDDTEIINIVINLLEKDNPNYTFYYAANGIKGIEVAEKQNPDIIIIDWEMPGLSGINTILKLKENEKTKNIPIVMLTGIMTNSENLKTAFEAGAIDFIRKPIDKIELTSRIRSMLLLAEYYNETIGIKNRELASTAMNILQNNQFNLYLFENINEIKEQIGQQNEDVKQKLNTLASEISAKMQTEAWTHFETYFNNVYPSFFLNLLDKFPDLSPAELKLAAFLRLNLGTKEIASILFITPESIKTFRTRLRRKLNLDSKENITTFLLGI